MDLFTGYGGITLGLSDWTRPIAYCEIDRYCQAILLSRISEGKLPNAPIWDDIQTLDGTQFRGEVDIIYGGFPCQDISYAGLGKGLGGDRSGLFFELHRLVKEINPKFIFLENVPGIRTRGLRTIIRAFTDLRYDCRWTRVSAKEVGANHLRQRWFLLGYSNSNNDRRNLRKLSRQAETELGPKDEYKNETGQFSASGKSLANPDSNGRWSKSWTQEAGGQETNNHGWWKVEPKVGRVVDGVAFRLDRIKALGNGVVPLQAKNAFEKLLGFSL